MVRNQPPHEGESGRAELSHQFQEKSTEQAQDIGHRMKEQMGPAAEELRRQGKQVIEQQKHSAAEQLRHLGDAARRAAHSLHDHNDHQIASYCDAAASQIDKVAGYFDKHDAQTVLRDARSLAHRHPLLVISGAFVVGLGVAQFLKAHAKSDSAESGWIAGETPVSSQAGFAEDMPYEPAGTSEIYPDVEVPQSPPEPGFPASGPFTTPPEEKL